MAADLFTPPATRDLDEAQGRVDAAVSGAGGRSVFSSAPEQPAALDQQTLKAFEDSAVKYNVPVDVLMAMAEKDSNFDALARSRGPGPKLRGIIKMSDADVRRDGVNPYMPDQAIESAARKLRGLMDGGNLSVPDAVKAYASGPDPSQWGPQAAEYADDVLSRTRRLKDAYYPPEPPPAPPVAAPTPAPEQGNLAQDYFFQTFGGLNKGLGSTVRGLGAAVATLGDYTTTPILNRIFGREGNTPNALDAPADALRHLGEKGQSFVSPDTKKAIEDSSPGGDLLKPSSWTLGKNPSLKGYTALGLDLFGGMFPILAASAATGGGAAAALTVGGLQGGGSAAETARDTINRMSATPADPNDPSSKSQLEDQSSFYKELIASGKTPAQALNLTRSAAERFAFLLNAPVSAVGGAVVGKALHPAANAAGGSIAGRVLTRMGIPAAEMGVQNPAASVATKEGINLGAGTSENVTEGTFGDFITGVLSGALPGGIGAARGELAHRGQAAAPTPTTEPPRDPGAMAAPAEGDGGAPAPAAARPAPSPPAPAAPVAPTTAAPPAPRNEGPLSRVLNVGAPTVAPIADIAGKRVVLTDKVGQMAGHIVGQDADGVMFKGDDGQEQLISHDEIASGETNIAEAPDAPARENPAPPPPPEAGPTAESVKEAVRPEKSKAKSKEGSTGLDDLGEAGKAIAENMYAGLFDALKAGKTTYAGVNDPVLARAKPAFDAGLIKTPKDLQRFENEGYPKVEEPGPATRESAPGVEEPQKAPQDGNLAEQAAAKVKVSSRPTDERPLAEMSGPELRARMKFLADQAKAGGWNKLLSNERRKVEAEIDQRASAATPEPEPARAEEPAIAPGKWFGSREKAQAFIDKRGLGDTHDIKKTGEHRFDVVETAKADATADASSDPARRDERSPVDRIGSSLMAIKSGGMVRDPEILRFLADHKLANGGKAAWASGQRLKLTQDGERARDDWKGYGKEPGKALLEYADKFGSGPATEGPDGVSLRAYGKITPRDVRNTPGLAGRIGQHRVIGERQSPWSVVDGFGDTVEEARADAIGKLQPEKAEDGAAIAPKADARQAPETAKESKGDGIAELSTEARQEPAKEPASDYGARNKLVSKERAETLRARLKQKFRDAGAKFNSGIDPEFLSIGTELAAFHIEAGARKFADFAHAMARDLEMSLLHLKPYLRSWYNGARDMMEDAGHDIAGIEGPEAVRAELARLLEEANNEPRRVDEPGKGPLEGVPADQIQGTRPEREPAGVPEGRSRADLRGNDRAGSPGLQEPRSLGNREERVPVPAARGETESEMGPRTRGERGGADIQRAPTHDEPGSPRRLTDPAAGRPAGEAGSDFAITDADKIGEGGAKTKFRNNLDAIRVLRRLEETGENATAADQAVLAKYVGWGGLPQAFERGDKTFSKGWEKEAGALRELLTPDELAAAAASTRNAHYTSPEIVKGVWSILRRLGFDRGRVLEPSVGVGNFFGLMPAGMRSASALHGVELDPITGGIARRLYPAAKIAAPMGFQDYRIPDGYFDAVIGNPPFGSEKLHDPARKDLSSFSIHNYFFAKALDGLKPGGIMAMVVTHRMLDARSDAARKYLADRADLVAAIRLPNDAFLKNAGTEVTTDIVMLRKRMEGEAPSGETWNDLVEHTDKNGAKAPLNEYFARHGENMLGEFGAYGSMYRPDDPALVAREGQDTGKLLKEAIDRLPKDIVTGSEVEPTKEAIPVKADVSSVRVDSMFMQDGKVLRREEDSLGEPRASVVQFPSEKAQERVAGMIGVRDQFADLRRLQLDENASEKQIEAARARLNAVYDAFVGEHSFLNSDANRRLFIDDPSWPNISALEDNYNKGVSAILARRTGEKPLAASAAKAAVFFKRTQSPYHPPTSAASAKDALIASLSERGRVDLDMMQSLYGKDGDTITRELGDLVYDDPVRGLVTHDEYLSGNVKQKLAEAIGKAKTDPAYERNVEALKAVQPADVHAADIDMKVGAHWTPPEVMSDFVSNITGSRKVDAIYNPATAEWTIRGDASADAATRWGTDRVRPAEVIEAAANQRAIKVTDKQSDGSRVVNETATQAANDKVNALKDEWRRWIFEDDARRERLTHLYNDMFNTNVGRRFDGSHLTFPGKVGDDIINLRPHQKNAIWRIIQSPTTLTDHVVGAGKTFTLVGAAMEMRRMGLAKKPMFTVPNHLVGQWAADFARLYPGAKILAASKKDFEAENRKRLFSRIATGDWDAVIVAHSSFGKVEVDPRAQADFIERQVADYRASEEAMRAAEGKEGRNVKQIQNRITQLVEKQKRLLDTGAKDNNIYWKELGVDALFLDEAHEFKNLEYSTSMQRVAGLGSKEGSQKASDMYLKVNQVLDGTGGRNITFATGTPISNTMAEMFTMQRYLDGKALAAQGLSHFDAWARMYGEVVTDWELSAAGKYKLNSRFAKFVNMPELMQRYQSFADVINRDDINAQLASQGKKLPVPNVRGGKPQNIVVERSRDQANYIGEPIKDANGVETDNYPNGSLVWRAENLPKKAEKGADNMLKIMSDARKAALDMRLIDPAYPDHPGSKVNVAADRIKSLYDKWNADKGAQLVFIDLSTPKATRGKEAAALRDLMTRAEAGDEDAQTRLDNMSPDEIDALDSKFSVYDDLKEKLVARGIPANEIEFIHSANTDQQKADLFGRVRSGQIRVLLGSTAKMGAGMNVQDRLVGLHHLDAPWRPSDLEQREGRIIRQGNKLYERDPDGFEVEINRYAAKQTLDSRMWQTIESKANFIEQVRKGVAGERTIEDIGGEAANAAEMKAAASGNPLILEEMALRSRIKKLSNEEYSHRQEQFRVRDMIRMNERANAEDAKLVETMKADRKTPIPEDFAMNVGGETFDKRKDAGAKILDEAKELARTGAARTLMGSYGGFKLTLHQTSAETFYVAASGVGTYETTTFNIVADPQGVAQRVANTIAASRNVAAVESEIAARAASVEKQKQQIGEWKKADELAEMKARHGEVIAQLKPKAKEQPPRNDPKASVAENVSGQSTMSATGLGDHLSRGADGPLITRMIDAGKIVLHDDASTLPGGRAPEGVTQGVTMPDGTIHLVAGNLTPESARAVLLHEAFHAGAEPLAGSRGWTILMDRVQGAVNAAMRREIAGEKHPSGDFWAEALDQARLADVPTRRLAEEVAAYAVENREKAPAGLRESIDNFVGQAKAWALKRFGQQFGDVTPGQLRALARAALHSWKGEANIETSPSGARYSMAAPDRFKPVDQAKTMFDRASHAASDFLTNLMAGYKGATDDVGKYSLLGAVPVRPLFLELARGMPAARHYIDTKQAMDAMRHRLNNEDAAILDKWSKWARATKLGGKGLEAVNKQENRRLMDMMHESTLAQVDPGKAFESFFSRDDQAELKKAKPGSERFEDLAKRKQEDDARRAAWNDMKPRFDAMSDAAREIYKGVRDAYEKRADDTEKEVVANIRRALDTILRKARRDHADEMERIREEGLEGKEKADAIEAADLRLAMAETRVRRNRAARMKRLREQFESNRLKGPYFPLARFGNFFVTARDADGKVGSFSRFESAADQRRFAGEMRKNPDYKVEESLAANNGQKDARLDAKFVSEIDGILEGANAPEAVRDQVWQRYLETLPDLSMRKNRIHRKGRAGYNADALRAFAFNMFHGAHQLSRLRYGQELQEHIDEARRQVRDADDPVRAQAVMNEMQRAHDFAMNPRGNALAYRLTSMAFLWTMGWNLSTGMVVLHDPIQRGIPNIGYDKATGNVGVKKSAAEVARAFKDVMVGKGLIENASTLTPDERNAMQAARDFGVIENTNAHDLAGVSEAGVDYQPWKHYLMQTASMPLHHAERVNREVTFMAAYRIARSAGMDHNAAIKNAANLTWMSQFDTQSSSKPRIMRGDIGRVTLALRNFHANILYRFFKDAHESMHGMDPEAKRAAFGRLVSSVAITAGMAGVRGAYFYKIIVPIAAAAMAAAGLIDKDDDPEELLRKKVLETTGDTMIGRAVGGMMLDGIPGYFSGTNLSDRIGVSDLGLRPPDREMNAEQRWQYWLEQLGGPSLEILHQGYKGASELSQGNIQRGLEEMLPAAFRNASKAARYAREGVRDKNGEPIVEDVAPQDVAKQAVGFTPAEISDRRARNTFQRNTQERIHHEHSEALRGVARARMEGEPGAEARASDKVEDYNAKYPEARITPKSIRQEIKRFRSRSDRMEFGVDLDPKLETRIKEGTAPSIYSRE